MSRTVVHGGRLGTAFHESHADALVEGGRIATPAAHAPQPERTGPPGPQGPGTLPPRRRLTRRDAGVSSGRRGEVAHPSRRLSLLGARGASSNGS
nr:hypothetical protein OG461_04540 [Streptomyces sp. NBC_00995]